MKYFLDTEFHEYKKKPLIGKPIDTIELISIGIVSEDGEEYYAVCNEFDVKAAWENEWLRENVLSPIYIEHVHGDMRNFNPFSIRSMKGILDGFGKTKKQIAEEVTNFCHPLKTTNDWREFYAYYADYDWVVFCWLFGRMIDLPKGFPKYCRDLQQMMDDQGLDEEWTSKNCPKPKNEHNALVDAKWNLKLYNAIDKLKTK